MSYYRKQSAINNSLTMIVFGWICCASRKANKRCGIAIFATDCFVRFWTVVN